MNQTHKIKITAIRRRILRYQPPAIRALCPVCAREVETLSTSEAAAALEVDDRTLDRLLATRQVHALRTVSGSLRVCRGSLFSRQDAI